MSRLNFHILRYDSLPSTNTEAAAQARRGAAEGLVVTAREQTEGCGRQERKWVSLKDAGLYCSIVLRPRLKKSLWSLLTLMTAIAAHDALEEVCALATDIKWSNDILANERKLCGILAETIETTRGAACIVGIGVNIIDAAFPPEIRERATSIEAEIGKRFEPETLLRALLVAFDKRYKALHQANGAIETLRAWKQKSSYAEGKRVRVETPTETFEGTTRGLEVDGALRVETSAGKIIAVRAGDVTHLRAQNSNELDV